MIEALLGNRIAVIICSRRSTIVTYTSYLAILSNAGCTAAACNKLRTLSSATSSQAAEGGSVAAPVRKTHAKGACTVNMRRLNGSPDLESTDARRSSREEPAITTSLLPAARLSLLLLNADSQMVQRNTNKDIGQPWDKLRAMGLWAFPSGTVLPVRLSVGVLRNRGDHFLFLLTRPRNAQAAAAALLALAGSRTNLT